MQPAPRAETDRGRKLGSLELGRFLAASLVFFTHFIGDLPAYAARPPHLVHLPFPLGVQYFFVLSGFVMLTAHRQDFGRLGAVPRFWWRRACRLYPVYWLSLAIALVVVCLVASPRHLPWLFSLWPTNGQDYVPTAWSLRFEVAFYFMFGLCLLPYVGRWLLAAWVLAVLWLWRPAGSLAFTVCAPTRWFGFFSDHHRLFFSPMEFYFFAGLLGGWLFLRLPLKAWQGWALAALGLAWLARCGPLFAWGYLYGDPLVSAYTGLGFAALIAGVAAAERAGAFRPPRWAERLGAVSYPLYILHAPLLMLFGYLVGGTLHLRPAGLLVLFLAGSAAIYGISFAVNDGFDRPIQRALRRLRGHDMWARFVKSRISPSPSRSASSK